MYQGYKDKAGFNTQPPEGGWEATGFKNPLDPVSTHSRLKAAGFMMVYQKAVDICFNTQPPEGGWEYNHGQLVDDLLVSTHSRLKAAGP